MRFLIVDDSNAPLKVLERVLLELGHRVIGTAHSGLEAVEAFERLRPDAVVMDVIMPKLNGLDALRLIRRIDPRARVVMACSLKSCETALESERLGAAYYLFKPFEEAQLKRVINRLAEEMGQCQKDSSHGRAPADVSSLLS
jgi:two-component system chemotaxis response regulator CheY